MRRRNYLGLDSDETIGLLPMPQALAKTVFGWNALALQAIQAARLDASGAARALALLHTCMYNAWAAYDDDARQTVHGVAVRLPRAERSAASKASAMSHAAHLVLCERFAARRVAFDGGMAVLGLDPMQPAGQFSPAGIGRTQAASMLDLWRRDGAVPFAPAPQEPPGSFCPNSEDPAPRWCRLAHHVSERGIYDDDQDVLLYFALANALADGAGHGEGGAAAAEVLRRFTGSDRLGAGLDGMRGFSQAGREIGARVFDKARRYWLGKL